MAERDPGRLNVPGRRKRSALPRIKLDNETFGRFAEGFARFMGTPQFIGYMTIFVILWITFNVVGIFGLQWDPYPFILLNLFFSTQASYAAPLILLATNRQEARDRVAIERDREQASQSRADMDFLAREIAGLRMSVGELVTRDYLRSELRSILAEIDRLDADQPHPPGQPHSGGEQRGKGKSVRHSLERRRASER